jgi:TRAP-type uncharacterized transport system substrate-binding protein
MSTENREEDMKFPIKAVAASIGLAVLASAASAESVNVTLSGGNPSGLWSLLGAGIDRAVKADDPSGVVTYQATGGGFANIGLLGRERTDLGMAHDAEIKLALAGDEPFDAPIENLQAIGYMYNWAPMHFFIKKSLAEEYGIDSIDDLATSGAAIRVANNNAGNIVANITTFMLEEAGYDEATIESNGGVLVRGGSSQQADLIASTAFSSDIRRSVKLTRAMTSCCSAFPKTSSLRPTSVSEPARSQFQPTATRTRPKMSSRSHWVRW